MYLMIENKGEANINNLILLGVSSARGKADKIGQFGTGFCHGVLTCLRNNIIPEIFIGKDELLFNVEKQDTFSRVGYFFRGEFEKLSMALEFGALDWNNVQMGLREFVSNAIDNGDEYGVSVVSSKEAKPGYTRVFLPLVPEVNKFFSDLTSLFLHFSPHKDAKGIFAKTESGKGKVYRKGVFVRDTQDNAMFNYNFGENLRIDECRNLSEYSIRGQAARELLASDEVTIGTVLGKISQLPKDSFEGKFSGWDLLMSTQTAEKFNRVFKNLYGDKAVICQEGVSPIHDKAKDKGYTLIPVPSIGWYESLAAGGIPTALSVCAKEISGDGKKQIKQASAALINRVFKMWGKLEKAGFTKGKQFPKVGQFKQIMDGGSQTFGYYDPQSQTVFIHDDHLTNKQVILEELAHYITGSTDNSRDFQDFAFAVAAFYMK